MDALDRIRDQLLDGFERASITVVGAEVERISTNALIMLLSAAETARRNDLEFALANASAPMLAAIERLGLGASFDGLLKR